MTTMNSFTQHHDDIRINVKISNCANSIHRIERSNDGNSSVDSCKENTLQHNTGNKCRIMNEERGTERDDRWIDRTSIPIASLEPLPINHAAVQVVDYVHPLQSFTNCNKAEVSEFLDTLFWDERNQRATTDAGVQDLSTTFEMDFGFDQHDQWQLECQQPSRSQPLLFQQPCDLNTTHHELQQGDCISEPLWVADNALLDASMNSRQDSSVADSISSTSDRSPSPSQQSAMKLKFRKHHPSKWMRRYKELQLHRQTFGHCFVDPNQFTTLSHWVKRQRYQYKLRSDGRHSTMTDERQQMLEALDFVWDSHDAVWEQRFNELLQFKKKHGHTNVPLIYEDNPQLGIWVKGQRKQRLKDLERGESLRAHRVERLNSIGFKWVLRPSRIKGWKPKSKNET